MVAAGVFGGGCGGSNVSTPEPSPTSPDGATGTLQPPGPSDAATGTSDSPSGLDREQYYAIWGAGDADIWAFGVPIRGGGEGGLGGPEACKPDGGRTENVVRRFDGTSWSLVNFGAERLILDAHGSASNDVWAVGMHGAVWRWNGQAWTPQDISSAVPHDGSPCPEVSLHGVWARAHDDVWAVGYIYPSSEGPGLILHFDGAGWKRFPVDARDGFLAVWAGASNDAWATGASGIAYHFDGTTWTRSWPTINRYLYSVWGSGPSDVWAAGNGGALIHFDGQSWSHFPDAGTIGARGILTGRHSADVWAAFNMPFGFEDAGAPRLLHWDGGTWTPIALSSDRSIADLWSSESGQVWSAGTTLERLR